MSANRYNFNLRYRYVWHGMFTNKYYFWRMWGIKETLWFLIHDTWHNA